MTPSEPPPRPARRAPKDRTRQITLIAAGLACAGFWAAVAEAVAHALARTSH